MNFKVFSLLIANVLLCYSQPQQFNKRGYEPLSGQGDVTYYGEGGSDPAPTGPDGGSPGACALAPRNKEYFAALNYIQYGEYPNPNNSVVCGRCVKLVHESNEVVVEIVDKCPACQSGDVDLSPTAFKDLFGGLEVGRVHNVKWFEVSCDELGKSTSAPNINIDNNKNIVSSNDNWNIDNNGWNIENNNYSNNNQNISYKSPKTIPKTTTKTIPKVTTKTIPRTTVNTLPKSSLTIKNENIPTPITITTSTVITAVFTIPITTVITDYNNYQAAPTNMPSENFSNNNSNSYQCVAN